MPNTGLIRGPDWGFANELFTILQREVIIIITFTIPRLSLLYSFPLLQKLSEACHQAKFEKEQGTGSPGGSTQGPRDCAVGVSTGKPLRVLCPSLPLCSSSVRISQAQEVLEAQRRNQSADSHRSSPHDGQI